MSDWTENISMDKIFDTASIALNTGHEVYNALNRGFDQYANYQDPNSRRYEGANSNRSSNYQPVQYGYGYEERYNPSPYDYNFQQNQYPNNGYYGFWNPMYGKGR